MSQGAPIRVADDAVIYPSELKFRFVRASGPGGQNVNKVATAVELRFNVEKARGLPADIRLRLTQLVKNRISETGELLISARRRRYQAQNRAQAIERLVALVRAAAVRPKTRKKRRPSMAAKKRRLENKRRISEKKRLRRAVDSF